MSRPQTLDLAIPQGKTFSHVLRWDQGVYAFKEFAAAGAIVQLAPLRIKTAAAHGMPDGWSFRITNVLGMTQLNSRLDNHEPNYVARAVSGQLDQVEVLEVVGEGETAYLREVNAAGFSAYVSGGYIEYALPVDLLGMTMRWMARKSFDAADPAVFDYSTTLNANGSGIVLDNTAKTVTLQIALLDTAALDFDSLLHEIEVTDSAGKKPLFVAGRLTLDRELVK